MPAHDVQGYCDDARRVIWLSPGLTGNELDASIVHEIVHAVAGPGHTRRFIARLRLAADVAADVAPDRGLGALAVALRTEADLYESTPKMRAGDVYLEIEDAAWQGAPLAVVAAGIGLTQAELLRRYPRAARVHALAQAGALIRAKDRPKLELVPFIGEAGRQGFDR